MKTKKKKQDKEKRPLIELFIEHTRGYVYPFVVCRIERFSHSSPYSTYRRLRYFKTIEEAKRYLKKKQRTFL